MPRFWKGFGEVFEFGAAEWTLVLLHIKDNERRSWSICTQSWSCSSVHFSPSVFLFLIVILSARGKEKSVSSQDTFHVSYSVILPDLYQIPDTRFSCNSHQPFQPDSNHAVIVVFWGVYHKMFILLLIWKATESYPSLLLCALYE